MNKDYPCDIIRDLLPGYIDGILSEAGAKAVKEHLGECGKCSRIYLEMKEGTDTEIEAKEQIALDGFKKVRQHTRKLKIAACIAAGLLVFCILSVFVKVFVIGEPLSTARISADELLYDEETGCLVINGTINLASSHVSRVVWEQSEEDDNAVNVIVYAAETLPFLSEQREFTVSIPDMKGKTAYFACPDYDRLEIYNWKHYHYEELAEMENEIYNRLPGLERNRDALSYSGGVESVNGADGICYCVHSVIGENATFWTFNDKIITDSDFESRDYDIWISLDKPYQILIYDYKTGEYTEDYSIISRN